MTKEDAQNAVHKAVHGAEVQQCYHAKLPPSTKIHVLSTEGVKPRSMLCSDSRHMNGCLISLLAKAMHRQREGGGFHLAGR